MANEKKLVLESWTTADPERQGGTLVHYQVARMRNLTEWHVGQRLSPREVEHIMERLTIDVDIVPKKD